MSTFGKIDEFQVNDDWSQYIERLGHYFNANDISDTVKQKSILLSVVGAETYKLIHNLTVPNLPETKTYEELVELVKYYLCPQPNIIVQRCLFNSRTRQPEESVATFVNELRGIASKCEYGLQLNDNLRDRLVAGVNNDRIQQRLLQNPGLTFQTALTTCLAMETAAKNVQDLSHVAQSSNVHRLQTNTKNDEGDNTKTTCYRCGRKHSPDVCWFKNATCNLCGKTGHIKPVCRSSNQPQSERFRRDHDRKWRPGNGRNMTSQSKTHLLQEGDDEQCYTMYTTDSRYERKEDRIIESFTIQDQVIDLELDTGASVSVINENTYNQLKNSSVLKKTQMILRTYSGEKIIPIGMIDVSVIYQNREHKLPLVVVPGGPNLLGRNWLREIRLNWQDIQAKLHNVSSTQAPLNDVLHRYEHVFNDELGALKGMKASIHLKEDATHVFMRSRPVPYVLRKGIEAELERLETQGTIKPVEFSDWATPIVPIVKSDSSVRICGDYKLTVNKASRMDSFPIPKVDELFVKLAGGQK